MGWASGSHLMDEIIDAVTESVTDYNTKFEIFTKVIHAFMDADADTLDECLGRDIAYDRALRAIYEEQGIGDELAEEDLSDYYDNEEDA